MRKRVRLLHLRRAKGAGRVVAAVRKRNNRPCAHVIVQKLRRGKRKNHPQLDQMSQLYHPVKLLNYVQVAIAYLQDLC